MNINDFLPLLLKNSNPEMAKAFSSLKGGDNSSVMDALMGQMMGGKNSELISLMKMMQQQQKKTQTAQGLKPIFNFAPKDILGILVKFYS